MRSAILLFIITALSTSPASAQAARCPLDDGDSCEEWRFEQADKELADLVGRPSEWIDGMPAHLRNAAREALVEAQTQWTRFRDAECRRELTWSYPTARTKRGFLANCLLNMTFRRRTDLQEAYKFRPR